MPRRQKDASAKIRQLAEAAGCPTNNLPTDSLFFKSMSGLVRQRCLQMARGTHNFEHVSNLLMEFFENIKSQEDSVTIISKSFDLIDPQDVEGSVRRLLEYLETIEDSQVVKLLVKLRCAYSKWAESGAAKRNAANSESVSACDERPITDTCSETIVSAPQPLAEHSKPLRLEGDVRESQLEALRRLKNRAGNTADEANDSDKCSSEVSLFNVDLSSPDEVQALVEKLEAESPDIDIQWLQELRVPGSDVEND